MIVRVLNLDTMPPEAAAEVQRALLGEQATSPYSGQPMTVLGAFDLSTGRQMAPDEILTALLTR